MGTDISRTTNGFIAYLECPWCSVASSVAANPEGNTGAEVFFTAQCANPRCLRLTLISMEGGWVTTYPSRRRTYAPVGVPPDIARDFQEALACHADGHLYATALVARRVLQATARDTSGATGASLAAEIDAIPATRLTQPMKDAAHQVRLIGNNAAHANAIVADDVTDLVTFTEQLLEMLYVIPARVAATQARRT